MILAVVQKYRIVNDARMRIKPQKSRSLIIKKGKVTKKFV